MQFITSTLLSIGNVCYAGYYEYIIDLIGKLVCYAVYYKYIIDLTGKLVCYAVYYKYIIDFNWKVSMLWCSLLQFITSTLLI